MSSVRLEVAPLGRGGHPSGAADRPVTTTTTGYIALDWLQPGPSWSTSPWTTPSLKSPYAPTDCSWTTGPWCGRTAGAS